MRGNVSWLRNSNMTFILAWGMKYRTYRVQGPRLSRKTTILNDVDPNFCVTLLVAADSCKKDALNRICTRRVRSWTDWDVRTCKHFCVMGYRCKYKCAYASNVLYIHLHACPSLLTRREHWKQAGDTTVHVFRKCTEVCFQHVWFVFVLRRTL